MTTFLYTITILEITRTPSTLRQFTDTYKYYLIIKRHTPLLELA
jgi:hypothetical protein